MTRPRIAASVASCIALWIAIPAVDMENPTTATAGSATHMLSLATAAAVADLQVTKTAVGPAVPGLGQAFRIVVHNNGPSPVIGATVSDPLTAGFISGAWTCTADPGSSCGAPAGTGGINTTVSLETGDSAAAHGWYPLEPVCADAFKNEWMGLLRFTRDSNKQITGFIINNFAGGVRHLQFQKGHWTFKKD